MERKPGIKMIRVGSPGRKRVGKCPAGLHGHCCKSRLDWLRDWNRLLATNTEPGRYVHLHSHPVLLLSKLHFLSLSSAFQVLIQSAIPLMAAFAGMRGLIMLTCQNRMQKVSRDISYSPLSTSMNISYSQCLESVPLCLKTSNHPLRSTSLYETFLDLSGHTNFSFYCNTCNLVCNTFNKHPDILFSVSYVMTFSSQIDYKPLKTVTTS